MGDYQSPYEQYIYNYAMSGGVSSYNPGEDPQHQQQHQQQSSNKYSNNRDRNNRDQGGSSSNYNKNPSSNNYDSNRNSDKPNYNNDYKKSYNDQASFSSGNSDMQVQRETIFVANLPKSVTVEDLEKHFGSIGVIKLDKKTGQSKIWIYKDKQTGEGKGEATVTYDDEAAASAAIEWFNEKEVMGQIVKVSLATRKAQNFNSGGFRGGRGGGSGGGYRGGGGGGGGRGGYNNNNRNSDRGNNNDRPRGNYSNNNNNNDRGDRNRGPDRGGNDRYSRPAPY